MRLTDLAERLGCRLEGDGDIEITRVAGIEQAGAGDLTFLANPRYTPALSTTRASAVILDQHAPPAPCAVLRASNPYLAFAEAVQVLHPSYTPPPGIDRLASIADDAHVGEGVSIGPFVTIGSAAWIGDRTVIHPNAVVGPGARIGDDCIIHSQAVVRERIQIGNRVVLQNGAVIGSDGFGFVRLADGSYRKIPQPSIVVLEDDVEIGANTTIDRPAVGETRVRSGTKIDNLVQIAHGVTIGRNTILAAQVGIAGSSTVGDAVQLAGQVGVAGHLQIGNRVVATAQTGIPNSVEDAAFVSGYPAIDNRKWLKASAVFRRLPELKKTIVDMERRIAELEERLEATGGVRRR